MSPLDVNSPITGNRSRTLLQTCKRPCPWNHWCLCCWLWALSSVLKLGKCRPSRPAAQQPTTSSLCFCRTYFPFSAGMCPDSFINSFNKHLMSPYCGPDPSLCSGNTLNPFCPHRAYILVGTLIVIENTWSLLSARHQSKQFTSMYSLYLQSPSNIFAVSLFYRWVNWVTEQLAWGHTSS